MASAQTLKALAKTLKTAQPNKTSPPRRTLGATARHGTARPSLPRPCACHRARHAGPCTAQYWPAVTFPGRPFHAVSEWSISQSVSQSNPSSCFYVSYSSSQSSFSQVQISHIFQTRRCTFPRKIWEENGGSSYSLNSECSLPGSL